MRSLFLIFSLVGLSVGCNRFDTYYGESDGNSGRKSVNGFAAFRDSLELEPVDSIAEPSAGNGSGVAELRTRDLSRLSGRSKRFDAIVWLPTNWSPMNMPTITSWMETWLATKNKTLVFIIPDGGSTEAYLRAASTRAAPNLRLEYRRRLAQQINDRLIEDVERGDFSVPDWFTATALPYRVQVDEQRVVQYDLSPSGKTNAKPASGAKAAAVVKKLKKKISKSNKQASKKEKHPGRVVEAMQTVSVEVESQKRDVVTLLKITDPSWKDSSILVVGGGALVTNFAMTSDDARVFTDRVALEIRANMDGAAGNQDGGNQIVGGDDEAEPIQVAFLSSDLMPIPVSDAAPGAPAATGMELLTTWPISLVTIHALFLGFVTCLMLLPTFGRPRRVRYNRVTHFGNHLDAMAALMRRAGGMDYAQERVRAYMLRVRGESGGAWDVSQTKSSGSSPFKFDQTTANQPASTPDTAKVAETISSIPTKPESQP